MTPEVSDQEDKEDAGVDVEKMDQTEELFSDPDKSGDEGTASEGIASSSVANNSLEFGSTTPTSAKRSNPFRVSGCIQLHPLSVAHSDFSPQMTTPVSKKIQVERRSSFLDNICADVEEEGKKRKNKKQKTSDQLSLLFGKGGYAFVSEEESYEVLCTWYLYML